MRATILETLERIEYEQQVKILYAVESGSRAWGFASEDSDYDVRYIFIRPPEDYLRIDAVRDTIEGPLDETLDFSGWDIRKALLLLRKSNPSLLEWNGSPIVYRTSDEWARFSQQVSTYFDLRSNMYHYLSMTASHIKAYLQDDMVIIKKYLYTLRPILCCRWILQNQTAPPVLFDELRQAMLPPELRPAIEELLHKKRFCSETQLCAHVPALDTFIQSEHERIAGILQELPRRELPGYDALNELFMDILLRVWRE